MRQTTNTPKQLVPAYLDSRPASWRWDYVRNLRPVRGYPNWWRIVDNVAYIDGPPTEGEQYTRDLYVWKVSILQDAAGNNTDTLELYNLVELLDSTERVLPNGDTEYRYKYSDIPPVLTYQHTDVIDSVSLEFDQLGRRLIAFESAGDVFLIWYDSALGSMAVTNWGQGKTPHIVTDTYRRTGDSADSERLLFYVDNATNQMVYRKQLDRYQTAYQLPSSPSDVVEILKVSKNLYGGLTVLYVYEDTPGSLLTGSYTARSAPDTVTLNTDGTFEPSEAEVSVVSSSLETLSIVEGLVGSSAESSSEVSVEGYTIALSVRSNEIDLRGTSDSASVSPSFGGLSNLEIKSSVITTDVQNDFAAVSTTSGNLSKLEIAKTLIITHQEDLEASVQPVGAHLTLLEIS